MPQNSTYQPLVSVVISAYNAARFIHETLDALLIQTYQNFEILAVNDCSTDTTGEILDRYAQMDTRIRVFHNPVNVNAAPSKNKGIDMAQGKYIAINDADDISLPDRLEKQVRFLEMHSQYSFVSCMVQCFYDDINPGGKGAYATIKEMEDMHFNYMSPDGDYEKTYRKIREGMILTNRLCHSSIMGHANVYKKLKYKEVFAEDWELFNRALIQGYKITKVPEVLLRYRIISSGMCGVFGQQSRPEMLKELKRLNQLILQAAQEARNYSFILKFHLVHDIIPRMKHFIKFYAKALLYPKPLVLRILGAIRRRLPLPVVQLIQKVLNKLLRYKVMRHIPLLSRLMVKVVSTLNTDPKVMEEKISGHETYYNIGIWTIEEKWLMGGLYTIIKIAQGVLKTGRRVRFINYGLHTEGLVQDFRRCLKEIAGFSEKEVNAVEIVFYTTFKEKFYLCHPDDRFIAGYWHPAEAIQKINKTSGHFRQKNYGYIIQDYEPSMLYRWGSDYIRSYNTFLDDNYYPLFNNSEFVCGYMKKLGLIDTWLPEQMLHGEPCYTEPPNLTKMAADTDTLKLLFYSRPSVDKNIYDIKIEALRLFIDALEKQSPDILKKMTITGIGEDAPSMNYKGVQINNLGKLSYKDYPSFIQNYNIGLSCIISPAFAYPCIEFPRAGLVTVVNRFETRDLEKYSENIISCDNSAESICEKLLEAVGKIRNIETRQRASKFQLPGVSIEIATYKLLEFLG